MSRSEIMHLICSGVLVTILLKNIYLVPSIWPSIHI